MEKGCVHGYVCVGLLRFLRLPYRYLFSRRRVGVLVLNDAVIAATVTIVAAGVERLRVAVGRGGARATIAGVAS